MQRRQYDEDGIDSAINKAIGQSWKGETGRCSGSSRSGRLMRLQGDNTDRVKSNREVISKG